MLNEDTRRLLARCRKGDAEAQEELLRAVQPRIYYYCLKMLKDARRAAETERKIFCELLSGLGALKNDDDFPLWAVSTAARLCRAAAKSSAGTPAESAPFMEGPAQVLPDSVLDSNENRRLAAELTASLPDVQRECVLMYYYLEMSVSEIASALHITESAVKTRLGGAQSTFEHGFHAHRSRDLALSGVSLLPFLRHFLCRDAEASELDAQAVTRLVQSALENAGRKAASAEKAAARTAARDAAKKAGKSPLLVFLSGHRHETFAAVFALVLCAAALIGWISHPQIENTPDDTASAQTDTQSEDSSFVNPWTSTDSSEDEPEQGVELTVHHRVLAARSCALVTYVSAYDRATGDAIPASELEWSVSRRSMLRFDPDDGTVSIPGDPLGEKVSTGTVELTVKWGKYTDTAVFDLVEPHENAILDRNTITLPAYTETTAVPTSIDTTQDGVIVLRQIFSGYEFYFDKSTQTTVMTEDSYTDEIESVEWIVDDPSIAEAVPQASQNGKTYYCTFRTYRPGETCLTCRVTRTDGSTAYQYCDITVVEPTEEQQTDDSALASPAETAPESPDAATTDTLPQTDTLS